MHICVCHIVWPFTAKLIEVIGQGVSKLCGAMDGEAQAPHGWAEGACFETPCPIASAPRFDLKGLYKQKRHQPD
jgi:hypothetical protein